MQVSAQTEIIVGDVNSTQTSLYIPLSAGYRYSYNQTLYSRENLVAGEISSISYYFQGNSLSAGTVTIYMKETSATEISGFSSAEGFVQVYSGALNLVNGWTTLTFPEVFEYSGQNNLIVAVIRSESQYHGGANFKVSPSDASSITRMSDTQAYDLNSTHGYGSIYNLIPVTKFGIFPSEDYCYPPNNLYTYVSSSESATVSWSLGDASSNVFALAYKTELDEDWIVENDEINDTSYTLTSLQPYTKYYVKVWTVCSIDNTSFERETSFITQPDETCFITLTYEEDFDDINDLSEWRYTNNGVNRWHVGPAVNNTRNLDGSFTEGNALYISNDGGLSNEYSIASNSNSCFSTLVRLYDSVHYGISFDYKFIGESYCDRLMVYLAPLYAELGGSTSSFTLIGTVENSANTWRRYEAAFPANIDSGTYQLVLWWRNDGYGGENPPIAIDNLRVQASMCAIPHGFSGTIVDVDGNASMTVSISDTANQAASYIVEYRLAGESIWDTIQSSNPVEIPYLPYSSIIEYRVVASCGTGGLSMPSNIVKINTPCGVTEEYPYKEYFETNVINSSAISTSQYCWKIINGGDEYCIWQHTTSQGIKGSNAIRYTSYSFSSDLVFDDWLISPVFALNGNQRLNFQYKLLGTGSSNQSLPNPKIDVYLYNADIVDYTSPEDTIFCEYFTTIYDTTLTASKWKMVELLLGDYIGNYRIALVVREATKDFFVDNFKVSDIPDCFEVYGLEVSAYSGTSVSINYEIDNVSGAGVAIAYAPETVNNNFEVDNADIAIISGDEELPYILEGLEPGTTYVFAAAQLCGEEWSDTVKASLPRVYSVPFFFDFDTDETTPDINFTAINEFNKWYIGGIYNNSEEGDTVAGRAIYVTADNGTSASYEQGNNYNCYAHLNVDFASGNEYELLFDWICEGYEGLDYLKVYLVPFGLSISEEYAITGQLNLTTQWTREQIILPANRYNGGYQLIFEFKTSGYNNMYRLSAIIDNIRIKVNDCARIVDLGLSVEETENTPNIIVDLLDEFNTNASYVLRYKKSSEIAYTEVAGLTRDSFPYTLSNGIGYQEIYQLQIGVICEQGAQPYFNEEVFSIMTPCTILQTPWEETFDVNILEEQYCWETYNGLISAYDNTFTSNLSPNSAWLVGEMPLDGVVSNRLYARLYGSDVKEWVVTPSINLGDGSVVKQLVFDLATRTTNTGIPTTCGDDDKFVVILSTDNGQTWNISNSVVFKNTDEDTVHNLSSLTNQAMPFSLKLVDENNQALTGLIKVAFYVESTSGGTDNLLCIDNLSVEDWEECQTPHNPYVLPENIRANSAIVNFTTLDNEAEYFEYVVADGLCDNFDALPALSSSETTINLTDLEDETLYTFAVRSVCSETLKSSWISTTFTTLIQPETIPFVTTFSDSVLWHTENNGITTNAWSIGSATSVDTNGRAAYISTDGGISYDAEISSLNTIAYLWEDVSFGETTNNFELLFDWKCRGRESFGNVYGGINVYVMDIAPLSTSALPNLTPIIKLHSSDQWQSERIFLGNITGDKRLVFAAYGYLTENEAITPAALDNIELIVSPCSMIEDIVVVNTTVNTIELSWTETGADNYVIYYRDEYSTEYLSMTSTENYATLSSLGGATLYDIKIKGVCGENESLFSEEISVTTGIETSTLPYSCNFEGPGANGWVIKTGNCSNRWWVGDVNSTSNSALFVTNDNGLSSTVNNRQPAVVIAEKKFQLGQRDSVRISFDIKIPESATYNYLKVFFVPEDVNFEASMNVADFATKEYSQGVVMNNSQNENYYYINNIPETQNLSVTVPNPFNQVRKLVFVWVNSFMNINTQGAIIDNVLVEEVGDIITCMKPVANSVGATGVLQTTANIYWQDNDESHTAWNVYYKAESDMNYNYVTATNQTSITLTDLTPYTAYYAYVRTNCGDEESYSTDTIRFHTHCYGISEFPYTESFEDSDFSCWILEGERGNDWSLVNNSGSGQPYITPFDGNQMLYYRGEEIDSSMLASPIFNLSSLINPTLKFSYRVYGSMQSYYGLHLYYRDNQGAEWIRLRTYTSYTQNWVADSLILPNISSSYQVAFQAIGTTPLKVAIDAVSVYDLGHIEDGALADAENANMLQTTIFPNPANNQATLRVEGLKSDAKVMISDLQGRIIGEGVMKQGEKEYKLDLRKFASGVYYIKILTEEAVSTQKLIVE